MGRSTGRLSGDDGRGRMRHVDVRILGEVAVTIDGVDAPLGGPKPRLVLALMLTRPGRVVPTDQLVNGVWGDDPPADPRRSLQVAVSGLRRALNGVDLEHRDDGYALHVDPRCIDAVRFDDLVEQGVRLVDDDPARSASILRDALGLWRGRPFGRLADQPELAPEVGRLEDLQLRALEARIDADLALGRHADLVAELREHTRQSPLRERFWGQLIVALYHSGRQGEALLAYRSASEILAEDLGIDPSPELQDLHRRILQQDPSLERGAGDAVASPSRDGSSTPRTVRGYELLEETARGRHGVTYRGRHVATDRPVSVTVIGPELADDLGFVRGFEAQAQRIARLEHPHIVPLHDFWREPGAAYLVWRWVPGESLAEALRRGRWNLEPASRLVEQVASALDVAHRHGVAHLAITPERILLEGDHAFLSDFPVARELIPAGSPMPEGDAGAYLAPEQRGSATVGPAADVFALGFVAFELLAGHHPSAAVTDHAPDPQRPSQPLLLPSVRELRPDVPAEVEEALRRATAVDAAARYATAGAFAKALRAGTAAVPRPLPARNPYKGLRAFQEIDADDFFGRERLVRSLVDRLTVPGDSGRLVAVVGPSGSGKSSLVRAGLIPALRRGELPGSERWLVATMLPGERPLAELERVLVELSVGAAGELGSVLASGAQGLVEAAELVLPNGDAELVLVVDQFEELFSVARPDERAAFLDAVRAAVTASASRVRVVATVRADRYDHALLDPAIRPLVAEHTMTVSGLSRSELERAVTEPSRAVGVGLHWDLIARIVDDVSASPGALPLLQYALTELFDRRTEDTLTLDGYHELGGVHGALASRADELYAALDPAEQRVCRHVLLRLVSVGDGRAVTRRRVRRTELAGLGDPATIDRVLETFGRHRLLTFDREHASGAPTVEVAHEALLTVWDRLRGWIDAAHDDLLTQRRLRAAVDEWLDADRDESYLLTGPRLEAFESWAREAGVALATAEEELLAASRAADDARADHEAARRQREQQLERRSARRLRSVAVVSALAAVVAVGLTVFAFDQRDRAERQERLATARALASAATAEITVDPERSVLLGIEAVRTTLDVDGSVLPEAETALRRALRSSRVERRLPQGGALSVAPDGRIATLGLDGTLTVWNGETGEPELELSGQSSAPGHPDPQRPESFLGRTDRVAFSPDGASILSVDADLRGRIRDATTGEVVVELDGRMTRPTFSPDGAFVAAVLVPDSDDGTDTAGTLGIWNASSGALQLRLEGHSSHVYDHAFGPDGSRLASTSELDGTRLWDLDRGELAWHVPTDEDNSPPYAIAFHPDGDRIVTGSQDGTLLVRDAESGGLEASLAGHSTIPHGAAFDEPGDRLVTTSNRSVRVWDLAVGEEVVVLGGHTDPVYDAEFAPGGDRVVSTSEDGTTRVWDVSVEGGVEYAALPLGLPSPASLRTSFSPDGRYLPVSGTERSVEVWDVTSMEPALTLETAAPAHAIAYSADGTRIATASIQGSDAPVEQWRDQIDVWDVDTGAHQATLADDQELIWDLELSPDGSTVITGDSDGVLRAVDPDSGEERFTRVHDDGPVYRVAHTPDGERLVVGAQDAGFVVDPATGETLYALDDIERSVVDVGFLDGERMVVSELATAAHLWDAEAGEALRTIHRDSIDGIAVLDDALAIATADEVAVRDLESGATRFRLSYDDYVDQVLATPDGRYLAAVTGSHVHVHLAHTDDLLDLAAERVTRALTDEECAEFLDGPCPAR